MDIEWTEVCVYNSAYLLRGQHFHVKIIDDTWLQRILTKTGGSPWTKLGLWMSNLGSDAPFVYAQNHGTHLKSTTVFKAGKTGRFGGCLRLPSQIRFIGVSHTHEP